MEHVRRSVALEDGARRCRVTAGGSADTHTSIEVSYGGGGTEIAELSAHGQPAETPEPAQIHNSHRGSLDAALGENQHHF